ncbi:autotransporter outer membrane beta-barrel domain-containing protein, partial [Saezia sanguinis]|uniref:autotransporter outer membrane beta-barrel domain-containing protein n=1 Tax=Saezia sanguinis TaxID=1965230 RepID=UPI000F8E7D72
MKNNKRKSNTHLRDKKQALEYFQLKKTAMWLLPASLLYLSIPAYAITSCPAGTTCTGTADFIKELRGGTLTISDLTMTSGAGGSGISHGFVQIGDPGTGYANPTLVANGLNFNITSTTSVDRGVIVASGLSGTTITTEIRNSSILFTSSGNTASNTVALLSESFSTGQTHNLTIESSTISSTSTNSQAMGVYVYSRSPGSPAPGSPSISLTLQGQNHISATTQSTSANALAIGFGATTNVQLTEQAPGGSITATTISGAAYGIYSPLASTNTIQTYSDITANSTNGNATGIYVLGSTANNVTTLAGEIKALTGAGIGTGISMQGAGSQTLNNAANITVTGTNTSSAGINATSSGGSNIALASTGTIQSSRYGIYAQLVDGTLTIDNQGAISSTGGMGISASASGTGAVTVGNTAAISTTARAIDTLTSSGSLEVINTGILTVTGTDSAGIYAQSQDGATTVTHSGGITTADGRGIHARSTSGEVTVNASGDITTGQATTTTHNHGIDAGSTSGKVTVNFDNGTIKVVGTNTGGGNSIGIAAWDTGSTNSAVQAAINLGTNATVDATEGVWALQIRSNGTGEINIASGAQVLGGTGGGIHITGTGTAAAVHDINNAGTINAMNDRAISSQGPDGTVVTIQNSGTIEGYITDNNADLNFHNQAAGLWDLRRFSDTDLDGIRDTKSVAISDFGSGTNTFINQTGATLRLATISGETTTVTTGEYVPVGALSSSNTGIVHGQLLNLNSFENAGTIDLSANGLAGDVLVITGGTTPGSYGSGQYISNGGNLRIDTVLNQGDASSLSDILVLDDAILGSGATKIHVNPVVGSPGGLTTGDGIKVVEVTGTSDAGSFALGAPLTYGAYEYILANGTGANTQNWYLQNSLVVVPPPAPYTPEQPTIRIPIYNPNIGSYLGNQYAAATMFNHNILDRRDNVRSPDQTLWIRTNHTDGETKLLGGLQQADISTSLVQIGADLIKQGDIVAGVYGGYGTSRINNQSNQTGTTADGKVEGYSIGIYGSWMPEQNKGPYIDLWGHYAWYDNQLSGAAQSHTSKYDSSGYALSAE